MESQLQQIHDWQLNQQPPLEALLNTQHTNGIESDDHLHSIACSINSAMIVQTYRIQILPICRYGALTLMVACLADHLQLSCEEADH